MNYSKLRGKIKEVFGTQLNFAKAMEKNKSTICAKLKNKADFTQSEIIKACELLGIKAEEIHIYFFTR